MTELTHDQKAAHFETWEHIHQVRKLLTRVAAELNKRALEHDLSKMQPPEAEVFAEFTPRLKDIEYGSDEYRACIKEMGPAVKHHQQNNPHHPEAHPHGVNSMSLIDLLEMVCDWKAATLRTKDGDIWKSLQIQRERLDIGDQLFGILYATISDLEHLTIPKFLRKGDV